MLSHSRRYPSLRRAGRGQTTVIAAGVIGLASLCSQAGVARAQAASPRYPAAAPIEQYRSKSQADEIALSRSAAPPSISAGAEVLVLGDHGYETAVKGTNGFVCLVERSWAAGFDDPEFWNPKLRGPNCFNATAARTELPQLLKRTEWVLSGASRQEIIERTRSAYANQTFKGPAPGALTYMLSKGGYLSDQAAGPWLPHMMFFVPHGQVPAWGACAEGSPIICHDGGELQSSLLLIPVRAWSDGSPALPQAAKHAQTKK
jgi:hypothetical protein